MTVYVYSLEQVTLTKGKKYVLLFSPVFRLAAGLFEFAYTEFAIPISLVLVVLVLPSDSYRYHGI